MPLIDLNTNLKDLTYGGNGPLITKDIKNPPTSNTLSMEVTRRSDDLLRIGKLLTTAPGIKHGINQVALNAVERNNSAKDRTALGNIVKGGWSAAKGIASTLAQIPVNGTGTHFVEGFAGKRGYLKGTQGHVEYKNTSFQDGSINTREIIEKVGDFNLQGNILKSRLESIKSEDKEYYSVGTTPPPKSVKNPFDAYVFNTSSSLANNQTELGFQTVGIQASKNTEDTYLKLSDKENADKSYTTKTKSFDRITAKYPSKETLTTSVEVDQDNITSSVFEDIINFRFKVIQPQKNSVDEPKVTRLDFRAYLDSFNDSFNGEWTQFKYLGRAEPFYNYNGFDRSISFGFKVAASSIDEMKPLYEKLNKLAGVTAPTYSESNYMRGTLTTVTVGDYLIDQPGIIEQVTFNWSPDYPWHIKAADGISKSTYKDTKPEHQQLPTVLEVQISFKPLHVKAPQADTVFIGSKNTISKQTSDT